MISFSSIILLTLLFLIVRRASADSSDRYGAYLRDPRICSELVAWVDKNCANQSELRRHLVTPKRAGPGDVQIALVFPWDLIGIDPASPDKQIRLIEDDAGKSLAVFFGEGLRAGIIVSLGSDFGVDHNTIIASSGRVAVYRVPEK